MEPSKSSFHYASSCSLHGECMERWGKWSSAIWLDNVCTLYMFTDNCVCTCVWACVFTYIPMAAVCVLVLFMGTCAILSCSFQSKLPWGACLQTICGSDIQTIYLRCGTIVRYTGGIHWHTSCRGDLVPALLLLMTTVTFRYQQDRVGCIPTAGVDVSTVGSVWGLVPCHVWEAWVVWVLLPMCCVGG